MRLAMQQEGFLGYENVVNGNQSIFISYWESMSDIEKWKNTTTQLYTKWIHLYDKKLLNDFIEELFLYNKWYKRYLSQICKIEHTTLFEK